LPTTDGCTDSALKACSYGFKGNAD
jgi:hypothetical protein